MAGTLDGAPLEVAGTRLVDLVRFLDDRGELIIGDHLPFAARRIFTVAGVPAGSDRGIHAHRACEQFLVCLRGSVVALVDDGTRRQSVLLDDPAAGLYMPALTWGTQTDYSADALLLVLASDPYDVSDYIDDYAEFTALVKAS
ncbi:MAG: FdtA/QdtA family cupin domain-containing protein [Pseudolysinimonas sp.]